MKILLDEQLSTDLIPYFPSSFQVFMPKDLGWSGYSNGLLREKLNERKFSFLVSADKNIPFQQNFNKMNYTFIQLDTPSLEWDDQIFFVNKTIQFLSNLPDPLPKLLWLNVEGFASFKKMEVIYKILPPDQILFM